MYMYLIPKDYTFQNYTLSQSLWNLSTPLGWNKNVLIKEMSSFFTTLQSKDSCWGRASLPFPLPQENSIHNYNIRTCTSICIYMYINTSFIAVEYLSFAICLQIEAKTICVVHVHVYTCIPHNVSKLYSVISLIKNSIGKPEILYTYTCIYMYM